MKPLGYNVMDRIFYAGSSYWESTGSIIVAALDKTFPIPCPMGDSSLR
jgi:hypothetical protein